MNSLIETLAKALNVSVDGISELLGNLKDSAPQLYEQLVREWVYWTVLGKSSGAMIILTGMLISYTLILGITSMLTLIILIIVMFLKHYPNMSMQKYSQEIMLKRHIKLLIGYS